MAKKITVKKRREPLPAPQFTGVRVRGESTTPPGDDIGSLIAMMRGQDLDRDVPQAVGPEATRGQGFREHVMGSAFDAPPGAPPADPALQASLTADAHAAAAELLSAAQRNKSLIPHGKEFVGMEKKPRQKINIRPEGTDLTGLHIQAKRAELAALQAGTPPEKLPQIPAIGLGGSEPGMRGDAAIAAASQRKQDRRIRVKESDQQLQVTEKAQSRDMSRRIRMRGMGGLTARERNDPSALTAANAPPWLVNNVSAGIAADKKSKFEAEKDRLDRESAERIGAMQYGTGTATPTPNWNDPNSVAQQPGTTAAGMFRGYDARTLSSPQGKVILDVMVQRFSPEVVNELLNRQPFFGYSADELAKINALRAHAGLPPINESLPGMPGRPAMPSGTIGSVRIPFPGQ